jgi:hypothetical protein
MQAPNASHQNVSGDNRQQAKRSPHRTQRLWAPFTPGSTRALSSSTATLTCGPSERCEVGLLLASGRIAPSSSSSTASSAANSSTPTDSSCLTTPASKWSNGVRTTLPSDPHRDRQKAADFAHEWLIGGLRDLSQGVPAPGDQRRGAPQSGCQANLKERTSQGKQVKPNKHHR